LSNLLVVSDEAVWLGLFGSERIFGSVRQIPGSVDHYCQGHFTLFELTLLSLMIVENMLMNNSHEKL
jgi:hypothetical protein